MVIYGPRWKVFRISGDVYVVFHKVQLEHSKGCVHVIWKNYEFDQ